MTKRLYTVDPPDRQEAATATVLAQAYRYDANGRRVEKVVSGGITERYVYSGVETVATYNGSNTWKQDFVFGQGIDRIVMLSQADVLDYDGDQNTSETTRSFYHRNALGSVMEITDMSQAKAVSYRYDPYGTVTITRGGQSQSTDPLGQHWTYTARFYDEESGLYYYRARAYDPAQARFLQRDPLGYGPGASLYEYAQSSPSSIKDPTGLAPVTDQDLVPTALPRFKWTPSDLGAQPTASTSGGSCLADRDRPVDPPPVLGAPRRIGCYCECKFAWVWAGDPPYPKPEEQIDMGWMGYEEPCTCGGGKAQCAEYCQLKLKQANKGMKQDIADSIAMRKIQGHPKPDENTSDGLPLWRNGCLVAIRVDLADLRCR